MTTQRSSAPGRLAVGTGAAVVAVVAGYLVVAPGVDPDERTFGPGEVAAHVWLGAAATVVMAAVAHVVRPGAARRVPVVVGAVGAMVVVEILQVLSPGRSPSAGDLAAGLVGVATGLVALVALDAAGWLRTEWRRVAVGVLLVAAGVGALVVERAGRRTPVETVDCPSEASRPSSPSPPALLAVYGRDGGVGPRLVAHGAASVHEDGTLALDGGRLETEARPNPVSSGIVAARGFGVRIRFTPSVMPQGGPARLVTISSGTRADQVNVHLGIDSDRLSLRLRTECDAFLHWTIAPPGGFQAGAAHVVEAQLRGGALDVRVDDADPVSLAVPSDALWNWDLSAPLVIGNEHTDDRPFLGTVESVEIYAAGLAEPD